MKRLIIIGTLITVINAFNPPSRLCCHRTPYHCYVSHVPINSRSSFQAAAEKGESARIPMRLSKNNFYLSMSSSGGDDESKKEAEDGSDAKMAKKVVGRKKRVVGGYSLTSALYLLVAVRYGLILFNRGVEVSTIAYFSCGSILASGLAYIQKVAAENDRLKSDTYKRLNVFMAWHGFLMSVVTPKIFQSSPLILFTNLIAMINSIKGYGYGAKGWTLKEGVPFVQDLTAGVKSTAQNMLSLPGKDIKSIGYFLGTMFVASVKFAKIIEIGNLFLQSNGAFTSLIGTRLHRCTKLGLLSVCMYSLKDAAKRQRLNGTTFIQLNFLSSLVLASMSSYVIQEGSVAFLGTKTALLLPTITAAFAGSLAFFTASNGILSIMEKQKD